MWYKFKEKETIMSKRFNDRESEKKQQLQHKNGFATGEVESGYIA
jgi:hypothetical protein